MANVFTAAQIQEIENAPLADALKRVTDQFPGETVLSSSLGQEDQVLTEVIATNKLPVRIFTLDTGRLFYEHYDLLEKPMPGTEQTSRCIFLKLPMWRLM